MVKLSKLKNNYTAINRRVVIDDCESALFGTSEGFASRGRLLRGEERLVIVMEMLQ